MLFLSLSFSISIFRFLSVLPFLQPVCNLHLKMSSLNTDLIVLLVNYNQYPA